MKQVEKLAREYAYKEPTDAGPDMQWAYEAGYRQAIKDAAKVIRDWDTSWYEDDTKLEAQRHDRETRIRALPDQEEP